MNLAPFISSGQGIHPVLDYSLLEQHYPLHTLDVWNISSASDLISWEKLRKQYAIQDPNAVPCDLFVWGTDLPPDARLTRIGGTPWLPKRIPWPMIDGIIPTFFCQFNFQDSRDLLGQRVSRNLPGDILLVFVADDIAAPSGDLEQMRFLWVSADEQDVITSQDVPTPTYPFEFVHAWGARYRTQDIPSKWDQAYEVPDDVAGGRCCYLPVLWGTKIGGVPYDSQENHDKAPKNFLCQLTSVQISPATKWPWIDRENPMTDGFAEDGMYADKNALMIGDMGELSLYLDDDNRIWIESACG